MKKLHNIGYFERLDLIDTMAKDIAKRDGVKLLCDRPSESVNPQVLLYVAFARTALNTVENYLYK